MILSGSKTVASFNPRTGKRIWVCDGPTEQCVASVVYGKGLVFVHFYVFLCIKFIQVAVIVQYLHLLQDGQVGI